MSVKTVAVLLASTLLCALSPAAAAANPQDTVLPVPESLKAEGIPPIPAARTAALLPYENIRNARLSDWHPTERRILIETRFAESDQIHEVAAPMGTRTQITFYRDPVGDGRYHPGQPDQLVYTLDEGGAENFQVFLLDRRGTRRAAHRRSPAARSRRG